jgi:hypothetical protein
MLSSNVGKTKYMIWFRKKQRLPEELTVPKITFMGEQNGVSEQELKSELNILFHKTTTVRSAFLARVDYGNSDEFNVALCIRSDMAEDFDLMREAGRIFSAQFGTHEHLDIIFLRMEQETDLRHVCKPFYER